MTKLHLLAFAVLAVSVSDASAQMLCAPRADIIAGIDKKYQERPNAFGIAGEKTLVELFTSEAGSWTMIMTRPGGVSCIMAVGQSWEQFPAPPAKMTGL